MITSKVALLSSSTRSWFVTYIYPLEVALSMHKAMMECGDGRPFDHREMGFEEVYDMYETVRSTVDPNPLVIDAEDLFSHPR